MSLVHDGCALPSRIGWHFYDSVNVVQAVNKFTVAIESYCLAICRSVLSVLCQDHLSSPLLVSTVLLLLLGLWVRDPVLEQITSLAENNKALELIYGWAM